MKKIKREKNILKTDYNGFIISKSSVKKILPPWKEAVDDIKNVYLKYMGDTVHSIYVRGSVACNEAIEGISDIDTFAVVASNISQENQSWIAEVQIVLEKKYDFSTGIDIQLMSYKSILGEEMDFHDRFIIKTQSACIYGEDLSNKIAPFCADKETANKLYVNVKSAILEVKRNTKNNMNKKYIQEWCCWIAKIILRTGLLLVMDQEKVFTRDLYSCFEIFSKYYPDYKNKMAKALDLAINPTENVVKLSDFLDDFGLWIDKEIYRKINFG